MIYGYARVSTSQQDYETQSYAILKYANEKNLGQITEVVSETISGKISWKKRKISDLVDKLKPGDVLIVTELSRLGRSLLEIFELISIMLRGGVTIHVIKGEMILRDDVQSAVFTFAFSLGAQIERDLISQRTKEALAAKKASGKQLGRPVGSRASKLDDKIDEIRNLLKKGISVTSIAKFLDIPQPTMYYFCKTRGLI